MRYGIVGLVPFRLVQLWHGEAWIKRIGRIETHSPYYLKQRKEESMVYKYSYRATQYAVPAQTAGEYLRSLRETHGVLNKKILLDESRDEEALLHNCFEWDDTVAAEAHRLAQAQQFINNMICVVVDSNGVEKNSEPIRAFVNVAKSENAEKGSFVPLVEALSKETTRRIVLENALRELTSLRKKYAALSELATVFECIDGAVQKLSKGA